MLDDQSAPDLSEEDRLLENIQDAYKSGDQDGFRWWNIRFLQYRLGYERDIGRRLQILSALEKLKPKEKDPDKDPEWLREFRETQG